MARVCQVTGKKRVIGAAGMRTINKNGLAATLKAAQEKGLIDIY